MKNTIGNSTRPSHLLIIDFAFRQFMEDNSDVGTLGKELLSFKKERVGTDLIQQRNPQS